MKECSLCHITIESEYFKFWCREQKMILCFDCFSFHSVVLDSATHTEFDICYIQNCTSFTDKTNNFLCQKHREALQPQETCTRCTFPHEGAEDSNVCQGCANQITMYDLRDYRKLGSSTAIKQSLQKLKDYESLGAYDELADLVSRKEIYKHVDEFKDGIVK